MVQVGSHGAMATNWWARRIQKEATIARAWQESYGPRTNGLLPQPPLEPRSTNRREVLYWNHHNRPRAWAVSQLGRLPQEERHAVGGQREARIVADDSTQPHSPLDIYDRQLTVTDAERTARRESAGAAHAAEAALAATIDDCCGAPQFKSSYMFHYGNPRLDGSPLPGGMPIWMQLSPRIQIATGHMPSGEARSKYPRDKDSKYREACISNRQNGYKGVNADGGSFINYRAGGSISSWRRAKPNERFG